MTTENTPTERQHHPFSPSTLQAREACPKYQPKQTASDKAARGTLQHAAAEAGEDDVRLSDEEALAVAQCLDFAEQRRRIMQAERDAAKDAYVAEQQKATTEGMPEIDYETLFPDIITLQETYLPVDNMPLVYRTPDGSVATADCTTGGYIDTGLISHDRTRAELFDWKFGQWLVEKPENNIQGISYLLGLCLRHPALKHVRVYFYQPHIGVIMHHDFDTANNAALLLRVRTVVARAVRAANDPQNFSMANPTVAGCLFCNLIGTCPKVAEIALRIGSKFAPLQVPETITPSLLSDPKQSTLRLRVAQVLKVWAEATRSVLTNAVLNKSADMPEGYSLATKSDRFIADENTFKSIALQYLTQEEFDAMLPKVPSLTKAEKVISAKAPRGQKTEMVKEFNTKLTDAKAIDREPPTTFLKAVGSKE